ncbi:MAG: indolepyruvate oxidoreductase subunit beta family protein, partial [Alphaproteobacteria bacterium]|nr:indolepyruvate oxidoreductase subunit beta family protein [Alphaproteobacteria bacterium]
MSGPAMRPLGVLVAALGGEGGGVLTDWIVNAALRADLPVQSTSIPGVAQRTGATTYYIEVFPLTNAALGGRRPVFGLYPVPGDVDAMIASELVEAGRAVENGFVTPDRTTLIASTHRVYATVEKIAMGDGRIDATRINAAIAAMAQRPILFDLTGDTARRGLPLNAVLLGALAGAGVLPVADDHFAEAIRESGIAVEANLAGFAAGLELARGTAAPVAAPAASPPRPASPFAAAARALSPALDTALIELLAGAADRLADYQDRAHAEAYLGSMGRVIAIDRAPYALASEVARRLALWMSYEDVIRVADLKTRKERFDEIRAEVRAKPDDPIVVTEHLKPGVDEIAAILPAWLGGPIHRFAAKRGLL